MTRSVGVRRALAIALAAALALPLALLWPRNSAHADQPNTAGWWTTQNPGVPAGTVPTLVPGGGPGGTPSDVPPGGFEVEAAPGITSYAALGYFTQGQQVQTVTLHIANGATNVSGSVVQACPLTGTGVFTSEFGGPLADGPAYDCAHPVAGTQANNAVTFSVGGLVHNDYLGIAIVGVTPTRMVFDPPSVTTITVFDAAPPSDWFSSTPDGGPVTPLAPLRPPAAATVVLPPPATADQSAPVSTPQVAQPDTAPQTMPVAISQPSNTVGIGKSVVGGLLLLLIAVGLIRRARRALAGGATVSRPIAA